MHKFLFYNKFIIYLYMFRALCAHRQEIEIVLYSVWYRHTCGWQSGAQVERGTCRNSTCAPDGHLQEWWYEMLNNTILISWWSAQQCSKHAEAYNKLIIKQEFVHYVGQLLRLYWDVRSAKTHTHTHTHKKFTELADFFAFVKYHRIHTFLLTSL